MVSPSATNYQEETQRTSSTGASLEQESVKERSIEDMFQVNDEEKRKIKNRIFNKSSQTAVYLTTESDLDAEEEKEELDIPRWLAEKIDVVEYSKEYIQLKQRSYICAILFHLNEIISNFDNDGVIQINIEVLMNQFNKAYKEFFQSGQVMNFLSILYLLENYLNFKEVNKTVLRDTMKFFKSILKESNITYDHYKILAKRYFELGIDIVSIENSEYEE